MGEDQGHFKDCPSCGSRIAEPATSCALCKSSLGRCLGCGTWLVEGTECWDCGKSTAVRARPVRAPQENFEDCRYDGGALGLVPVLALRGVLLAATAVAVVYAVAGSPLDPVTWWLCENGVRPLRASAPVLWGVVGGLGCAVAATGWLLRRERLRRTSFWGKAVTVRTSLGALCLDLLVTLLVLALTAGLGFPWLYARYRRTFFRGCKLPGGPVTGLEFQGSGEEVLVRFGITLLSVPVVLATGGLALGLLSWMWLRWELDNLRIPGRQGQMRPLRFQGGLGAYYGRWVLGWLVSLATAGLARPWVKASEWRWVAKHSQIA